ncbi:MraY family glycosyltransferase [Marinimicrobium alkaliphilum]|uniref:MraY family glycosyltransferase n=1 Tax=Marinimicrobium alkaliphilum TaxID=2202654 RepID=UPI001E611826|nr:glycosyltransferase family 4 protein [Marinimicrobium alkaliphilum]
MMLWLLLFMGSVLLASALLTWGLRAYAVHRQLLDIPNARSSHSVPTPRGGGVAIVVTVSMALVVLGLLDWLALPVVMAMVGGGAIVALIGWLDDHGHIAARWRLLAHFAGAAWGLYWLGGLPPLMLWGWSLDWGWLLQALVLVYLVWLLNLYNFMDGIDGIAGVEALTVCLAGVLLFWWVPAGPGNGLPMLALGAGVLGFLVLNYPPAKIFMGDAGSGFVGLQLGLLSVLAAQVDPVLFWAWLILLGSFIVDATLTLVRRVLHGQRFYEAHRSHAYQHLAQRYGHRRVTLLYGAINVCWLLPWALAVVAGPVEGVVGVLAAYVPLLVVFYRSGAGLVTPR